MLCDPLRSPCVLRTSGPGAIRLPSCLMDADERLTSQRQKGPTEPVQSSRAAQDTEERDEEREEDITKERILSRRRVFLCRSCP